MKKIPTREERGGTSGFSFVFFVGFLLLALCFCLVVVGLGYFFKHEVDHGNVF